MITWKLYSLDLMREALVLKFCLIILAGALIYQNEGAYSCWRVRYSVEAIDAQCPKAISWICQQTHDFASGTFPQYPLVSLILMMLCYGLFNLQSYSSKYAYFINPVFVKYIWLLDCYYYKHYLFWFGIVSDNFTCLIALAKYIIKFVIFVL